MQCSKCKMEKLQALSSSTAGVSRLHAPPGHLPLGCPRARAGQLCSSLGLSTHHAAVYKSHVPSLPPAEAGWRIGAHSAVAEDRQLRRMPSRMPEFNIEGPVIAVVTPFKSDSLRVDDESLIKYLQYLWEHGIQNIIVNGTTAEFASMSMAERMEVTELTRQYWPGTIINNISSASHVDALQYLRHSQDLVSDCQGDPRKVEAALLLPPFYFAKVTDAGLERWLRTILEVARMPVFLYNFPDHTGNFISPDLFVRLTRDFPLLRGIKNTFNDVALAAKFKGSMPERQVYVGFDGAYLQALQAGLDGNVSSGGGTVLVDTFRNIAKAYHEGDTAAAEEGQRRMDAWADCREKLGVLDLPAAKAALSGVIPGFSPAVRPPLVAATREQQQSLTDFVKDMSQ